MHCESNVVVVEEEVEEEDVDEVVEEARDDVVDEVVLDEAETVVEELEEVVEEVETVVEEVVEVVVATTKLESSLWTQVPSVSRTKHLREYSPRRLLVFRCLQAAVLELAVDV